MAASGAQIAALVARASRHRALLRRVRASGVFTHNTRVVCDLPGSLTWRTSGAIRGYATPSGKPPVRPSLAISEAFGDDNDDDDHADGADDDDELSFGFELDGDDQGDEEDDVSPAVDGLDAEEDEIKEDAVALNASALSEEEQRELAQRLRFAMDRKKQWMQRLAARGALDALLKVVVECYEPLYATHAALQRAPCPLWQAYEDADAVADVETKYKPKWYDDQVTKITEQEAMALFVTTARRPDLAMAVFRHREWLAAQLGSLTVSRGDNVLAGDVIVEFGKHFRSFYSWAMGASTALNDHAQVFAIYENALENGVFPTANMTQAYLHSLIAKREFEAVAALFAQIQKDDRPTNLYFYRHMLFAARVTGDSKTADVVLKEMKIKGFKVRAEDYLNALRALDSQYYVRRGDNAKTTSKKDDREPELWLDESYRECLARVADQEASPDAYASREKASGNVIKLFEEMVEDEQIPPHSEAFFPRVISAALFLHDYDRVTEYGALYVRCFNKPLAEAGAIKMTVNALLVKDEPAAALELVFQALKDKSLKRKKRTRDTTQPVLTVLSAFGNIIEYLASHQETALVLELLAKLDAKRLMGAALTPALSQMMLNTLVRDTQTVSNEQLWEMLATKYWMAFPVVQNAKALTQLLDACVSADRWWLISKVLHKRNRKAIPHLPARIALQLSKKGLEDTSDPERVEMVAHLANMVDIAAMGAEARVAFCCNVVRALHVLRHDSSRGLHRQREIRRLHDQFLRAKGVTLPPDVREILLENA